MRHLASPFRTQNEKHGFATNLDNMGIYAMSKTARPTESRPSPDPARPDHPTPCAANRRQHSDSPDALPFVRIRLVEADQAGAPHPLARPWRVLRLLGIMRSPEGAKAACGLSGSAVGDGPGGCESRVTVAPRLVCSCAADRLKNPAHARIILDDTSSRGYCLSHGQRTARPNTETDPWPATS